MEPTVVDADGPRMVARFGRTERLLHWSHAAAFLIMLASGLVLVMPALSEVVARRQLVKNVHLWTAVAWIVVLVLILALGDRRALRDDWREVETLDRDDRRWLLGRPSPQGKFNAGQKLNALLTVAFALLFLVSGVLLWLGERDHRFILDGTGTLHVTLTWISLVVLLGHLYLALVHPSTRHALRGITRGDVREDWAVRHHSRWLGAVDARDDDGTSAPP
jgi:formate dehydrogenase subunit gamma